MLKKVQKFVRYAQAIVTYLQKVVSLVNTALRDWPAWPDFSEEVSEE